MPQRLKTTICNSVPIIFQVPWQQSRTGACSSPDPESPRAWSFRLPPGWLGRSKQNANVLKQSTL